MASRFATVHSAAVDSSVRVLIRTVASAAVGAGHLRRCLSLAQRLHGLGASVTFALPTAAAPFKAWILDRGFTLHDIGELADQTEDARRSRAAVPRPDWVVVDDYQLDARWHSEIAAPGTSVAVIDDLADRSLHAELLVDPNEHGDHRSKYAATMARLPRLLGGCRFALLDPVYESAPRYAFRRQVRSIGIFMGGSDTGNVSAAALQACRKVFQGFVEIVATSANPRLNELATLVQRDPSARLSVDLPDLAAFYQRHDLQIGAAGGATWERCCIGAPTLALSVARNQQAVLPELTRRGVLAVLHTPPEDEASFSDAIASLINDSPGRALMAQRSRELVDGRGALRVALCMLAQRLDVVRATIAECELALRWRNDPAVREMSLQSQPIDPEEHQQWYTASLDMASRLMLIGRIGPQPVGVIRFDAHGADAARVSIFLDPGLPGLGLGPILLERGEAALRAGWPATASLVAEVVPRNEASLRMFRRAGYDGEPPRLIKPLH